MIKFIIITIFLIISIFLSYCDIKTYQINIIPNYLGIVLCFFVYLCFDKKELVNHICGLICMVLMFLLIKIINKEKLGSGDIHYSLFCGLISGVPGFIISGLITSFIGIIYYIVLYLVFKQEIKNKPIPFIPFMATGTIISFMLIYF